MFYTITQYMLFYSIATRHSLIPSQLQYNLNQGLLQSGNN